MSGSKAAGRKTVRKLGSGDTWFAPRAKTPDDIIEAAQGMADRLRAMEARGERIDAIAIAYHHDAKFLEENGRLGRMAVEGVISAYEQVADMLRHIPEKDEKYAFGIIMERSKQASGIPYHLANSSLVVMEARHEPRDRIIQAFQEWADELRAMLARGDTISDITDTLRQRADKLLAMHEKGQTIEDAIDTLQQTADKLRARQPKAGPSVPGSKELAKAKR
jgi:hypothetical protein